MGRALRESASPVATLSGPDYQRVLLGPPPALSAVVVATDRGVGLRELSLTTCALCSEPVRFVTDLLDEVQRRGRLRARLVPGVELDVTRAAERYGSDWVGLLQQRNQAASYLDRVLRGAEVIAARDPVVHVRYADGFEDTWVVRWFEGRWRLSYDDLAPDSPLRLSKAEANRWRNLSSIQTTSLQRYAPTFDEVGRGAGIDIGYSAVEAWPDPKDGTVLLLLMDLDRIMSGIVRVDPETREVVERWPVRLVDNRAQLSLSGWDTAWQGELSATGEQLLVRGPGRTWLLDLEPRRARLINRGQPSWVGWSSQRALLFARADGLWSYTEGGPLQRTPAPTPIVAAWKAGQEGHSVSGNGEIFDLIEPRTTDRVCCGYVTDAAVERSTGRTLVTCAEPCDVTGALIAPDRDPIDLPGAGADRPGASLSPDGRWLTTGRSNPLGSLLIWNAIDRRPIARVPVSPVRVARWSASGEQLLTVEASGRVVWWSLEDLLTEHHL
ncbi:MAG: hypothetical protein EA397_07685 [Deltaproteobacteria bacterium]|nr:MAG: hypothetical protein EA397_07685 [Deltaproteobacteria bacterium]